MLLVGGNAVLAGLVVTGAFRTGQPLAAWFGVVMLILSVPAADWMLRSVRIASDSIAIQQWLRTTEMPFAAIRVYGIRRAWVYRSGQWTFLTLLAGDQRVDLALDYFRPGDVDRVMSVLADRVGPPASQIARPHTDWVAVLGVLGALLTVGIALVFTSIVLPSTLFAERLFSEGAALGVVTGFAIGIVIGRLIHPAPVAVGAVAAVTLLTACGSAALVVNVASRTEATRTVSVSVASKRWYLDHGRKMYVVDLVVDGAPKRLFPNEAGWARMNASQTFSGCVREGRLGFPVILQVTHSCVNP